MPPAVIDAMASFRAAIDAQEQAESLRMAQAWLAVSRGLDQEFEKLARDVANAAATGKGTSLWHVQRMARYQSLAAQIAKQQSQFAPIAANEIRQTQTLLGRWGIGHSQQLIAMQSPAVVGQFDRLPLDAISNMVGNAGDGTPLGSLLRQSWGNESVEVGNVLVRGTALGWNPIRTARAMRDAVNVTLDRAFLIGRTEQMRVYREGSRQQYIESRVVSGYIRVASKSIRTCLACLMADGQFYPLSVAFEEHPAGRCSSVPVVYGAPRINYETGEQWFMRQDEATQRKMMGPGRYEAWQEGRFALPDLVSVRYDNTWGNSLQVTPVRVLANRPAASVVPPRPPQPPVAPPQPTPHVPVPQGTPVSSALTIPARSRSATVLREALDAIDQVHGDGLLDTLPVNMVSGKSSEATYYFRGTRAEKIDINTTAVHKRFSLVHEIGHWLDHQQIHATLDVALQQNRQIKRASTQWMDAVKNSQAYKDLIGYRTGAKKLRIVLPNGTERTGRVDKRYIDYLLNEQELWARAYSQYIITRSQHVGLQEEWQDYRAGGYFFDHWTESDFEPVGAAMDKLFETMGWRK